MRVAERGAAVVQLGVESDLEVGVVDVLHQAQRVLRVEQLRQPGWGLRDRLHRKDHQLVRVVIDYDEQVAHSGTRGLPVVAPDGLGAIHHVCRPAFART